MTSAAPVPILRVLRAWLPVTLLVACTPPPPAGFEQHDDRYQRCGARSKPVDNSETVAFSGTVHDKLDATPVDGGVDLVLIDGRGQPVKLHFGSLFTIPGPSAERQATYDQIRATRRGDCVQVSGARTENGQIRIYRLVRYDASSLETNR